MSLLDGNDVGHFRFFASQVQNIIEKYGTLTKDQLTEIQRSQVDGLSALELDFKRLLVNSKWYQKAEQAFFHYVCEEKHNLLSARPLFREPATAFKNGLMVALKEKDFDKITKYHLNFHFIRLVVSKVKIPKSNELYKIYQKVMKIRHELVLMNLPLVISRARIFYSKTPRSHLSFMDLVQVGAGGLLATIDKYYGQYRTVWRSVVRYRISGDHIKDYSDTFLHFYPEDRKRLYSANKFRSRVVDGEYTEDDLVNYVNTVLKASKAKFKYSKVTADELRHILLASSTVSCDTRPPLDDEVTTDENIVHMTSDPEDRPDTKLENVEANDLMLRCIRNLPVEDQQLLILKGVHI